MKKQFMLSTAFIFVLASCSKSEMPAMAVSPIELEALALFQREEVGNILGSNSWKAWVLRDGTSWVQRVESTRDSKSGETSESWRARGGVWISRTTRWRVALPEPWWNDAERIAGEHRFFEQSEQSPDSGRFLEGTDQPTILAISRSGKRRKVSKWEVDQIPDFDPLYEHLKILRNQVEGTKPDYEDTSNPKFPSEAEDAWKPPGFP